MAGTIAVINGPNLNLLGTREPDVYGHETLHDIEKRLASVAQELGLEIDCFQSNHEGRLIDHIHALRGRTDFLIINPGGLTHTSVSLRDALSSVAIPFIEIHLSNVHARESFRRHSYLSDIAVGVITGLGAFGYEAALRAAAARLSS